MTTLCYVASPSYSGSTLLALLLGTHPRIATVGELKGRLYGSLGVPQHCSCGTDVADCPFWKELQRRVVARGLACDLRDLDTYFHAPSHGVLDRLLRARVRGGLFEATREALIRALPGAARERQRLIERNRVLVETICEIQGGDVLVDSSKDAVRLMFLLRSRLWDVRVVHLLRDGRGVANSFRKRDGFPVAKGARRWRAAHESYAHLARELAPDAICRIRYEDLASEPEATVDEILGFLGLRRGQVRSDFMAYAHHLFGNPMRMRNSSEISLDEAWREELRPEELAIFERVAGKLNREFGYE
jgi:hypothetical protein